MKYPDKLTIVVILIAILTVNGCSDKLQKAQNNKEESSAVSIEHSNSETSPPEDSGKYSDGTRQTVDGSNKIDLEQLKAELAELMRKGIDVSNRELLPIELREKLEKARQQRLAEGDFIKERQKVIEYYRQRIEARRIEARGRNEIDEIYEMGVEPPFDRLPADKMKRYLELGLQLSREGKRDEYPDGVSPEMIEVITEGMDTLTAARFLKETPLDTWALQYSEMAVKENPNSYEANLVRAQTLPGYPPGVEGERIAAYYRTLEINPDSVDALVELSSMICRNRPLETLEYTQRAIELDSSCAIAFYHLGRALERLGWYEEAQNAYRNGIELGLGLDGLAAINLRAIEEGNPRIKPIEYEQQENQEIPYNQLSPETTLSDNVAQMLNNAPKGKIEDIIDKSKHKHEHEMRDSNTEAAYQQLAKEDPKGMAQAHYEYGSEMLRRGEIEEAIYDLSQAIELNPKHKDSYSELARAYERAGLYEEAASVYLEAIKRFPKDERLQREWDKFRKKHSQPDSKKESRK